MRFGISRSSKSASTLPAVPQLSHQAAKGPRTLGESWLIQRDLVSLTQKYLNLDAWLAGGPARYHVRDFLLWAVQSGHCPAFVVPVLGHNPGVATDPEQRWSLVARLLHDTLELTDRVAGAMLLLYGQQLSRITAMTTDQVLRRGEQVTVRFVRDDIDIPQPPTMGAHCSITGLTRRRQSTSNRGSRSGRAAPRLPSYPRTCRETSGPRLRHEEDFRVSPPRRPSDVL